MTVKSASIELTVAIVVLVATFWAGRISKPAEVKVETVQGETKTVTQTQIVYRDVIKEVEVHTKTMTTETKQPNGVDVITTVATSDSNSNTQAQTNTTTDLKVQDIKTLTTKSDTIYSKPGWRVAAKVGIDVQGLKLTSAKLVYGVDLDRRLFGTLWGGAWVVTDASANLTLMGGVSLSLEF